MKYEQLCNDILQIISTDNIQDVFCCITRLRLIVKDKSIIDREQLEAIEGVLQVKEMGNQIQLVIGTHVPDVYREFCSITGFKEKDVIDDDDEQPTGEKAPISSMILETLSSIFLPVLPAFCTGGMIKSLVLILTTFGLIAGDSGVATVLNAVGDAPFYFLPFLVGMTTAKRFGLNQVFGLMIAGCLLYPTFLNQTAGASIQFLFFQVPAYSYASSVLPTILCVIAFSYLYKAVDRCIPANLKIVLSGTISFAIFMPVLLAVVAPLGNYAGILLSQGINAGFATMGPVAGALFGGLLPFIIMAGMHSATFPVILQNLATTGFDVLMPGFFVNNIAVAGATIGASFKLKGKMRSAAFSNGAIGLLGITEPALYGIDVKYKQPLIGAILGGAAGGAAYMLFGVKCFVFAQPGLFSIPGYIDGTSNLMFMGISLLIAFVTAFAYSFVMTKDTDGSSDTASTQL